MNARRGGTLLLVVVVATAAVTVGITGLGQTQEGERPVNGQAPETTPTPASTADAAGSKAGTTESKPYRVTATNETALNRTVLARYGDVGTQAGRHVELTLSQRNLTEVNNLPWVQSVRPVRTPVSPDHDLSDASVYDQQAQTQSIVNTDIEVAGTDVEVGVIDKGFDDSNEYLTGNIAESRSFRENTGDTYHGTSVAEIVARIAPESRLYLATINSGTDTEAAIQYLVDQDVDIIVMSLSFLEDDDGKHFLTNEMKQARQNGVLFVTSAGNQADNHWEGEFRSTDGDEYHDWVDSDELNCLRDCQSDVSGSIIIRLDWKDDDDGSRYQAVLFDPVTEEVITRSDDASQYDGNTAFLSVTLDDQPADLAIKHVAGPAGDEIEISVFGPQLQHAVERSSLLAPADVPESTAVAAYEPDRERIAPYSSQGPTDTGQQGVTITGRTNLELSSGLFDGTSAAAPYVAGVAALIQDASQSELMATELEAALTETATDIGQPGPEPVSGAGIVDPAGAVESVLPENDRFEPNNNLANATALQPGVYEDPQIVAGEADLYAIELAAGASLTATARFDHAVGDIDTAVYAPNGTQIRTSRTATDNESVSVDSVSDQGTYHVLVTANQSDSAPYSLTIDVEQPTPTGVVKRFDDDGDGKINSQELLAALAVYDGDAPREEDSVNTRELLELLAAYAPSG